jgi:hypothetical protein
MKNVLETILVACLVLTVVLAIPAASKAQMASNGDIVAAITKMENDAVKADLAGDSSFYDKLLTADWTGGDSDGTLYTKAQMMKMMTDTAKNKWNSESIADLKVRVYGGTAVATYKDTYDAMFEGKHRSRTVTSTDTFVKIGGEWKQVASQAAEVKSAK